MFKINSNEFKKVVSDLAGAYRHSLAKDTVVTITAYQQSQFVSLSFVGEEISVETRVDAEVEKDFTLATSMMELQLKVSILPDEVMITVTPTVKDNYYLKWGRNNGMILFVKKDHEHLPFVIPPKNESISFPPGQWDYFTRYFVPFCSTKGDDSYKRFPVTLGVNFKKIEGKGLLVSATNISRIIQNFFELDWFSKEVTISRNTFNVVSSLVSNKDLLELSLDEAKNSLIIESSKVTVVARLLDGAYPDVAKFFNNEAVDVIWRTDRMELLEVARRIKRLDSKYPAISIFKKDSKYYANLDSVLTEQIGSVIETDLELGMRLDAGCLEAALTVLRSEEILITFSKEDLAPVTIFSGDSTEDGEENNLKVVLGQVKK